MKYSLLVGKKLLCIIVAIMILLSAFVIVAFSFPKGNQKIAYAAANNDVPFETWQGYATDPGRFGDPEVTQLELIRNWLQNAVATVEMGEPINAGRTESLKISSGNAELWTPFYGRGDFGARLDQTGAKYIQVYIKNLSGADKGLGFFLSDVSAELAANPPKTNAVDFGYEHWGLKWNAKIMLVDSTGTKSLAIADANQGIKIPKDFEGTVNIAINKDTLERPGWLVAQGNEWLNNEIDIERCFSIDPYIPYGNPNAVFLIGDVYIKTDSVLDEFLAEVNKEEQASITEAIRSTDSAVTLDYENNKIILKSETDLATFKSSLFILEGWTMEISDPNGFSLYADDDKIENDCEVVFSDGNVYFEYSVLIESGKSGGGCRSSITASTYYLLSLSVIALFIIKKFLYIKEK